MAKIKTVLIVCTGNSCRSVMAGAILKKMLAGRDDLKVVTAGTNVFPGAGASRETIEVLSRESIDVSGHAAQGLTRQLIEEADLILVMQRAHKEHILALAPEAKDKVHLLSEFGRDEREEKLVNPDIPDPIGRPVEFHQACLNIIKESLRRVVREITK